jgi:hypothetical protein
VEDEALNEKVLDFEGIQFLFIFYYLHWNDLLSFGDEGLGKSLLKDAYLGQGDFDFTKELVYNKELVEEDRQVLLLGALGIF